MGMTAVERGRRTKFGKGPDDRLDEGREMYRLRRDGVPIDDIAEQFGLSLSTVARRLRVYREAIPKIAVEHDVIDQLNRYEEQYRKLELLIRDPHTARAVVVQCLREQRAIADSIVKMKGLAAPTQIEQKVTIKTNSVDDEVADLAAMLGLNDLTHEPEEV